jgi:pimeloyl-ACP methyl ester carboxylesterase
MPRSDRAQVVLVHGAWHGPWCWERVLVELRARGIDAVAVDLPFTGFADDVDAARSAVAGAGDEVVVLGHSYGGAVVCQAVSGLANVRHLVFLAAFVNPAAASALLDQPLDLLDAIVREGDRCSFDPTFARKIFYGDSPSDVVEAVVPLLRPMVLDAAAMLTAPPVPPDVPSSYVVCTRDGAIPPEAQVQMAQGVGRVLRWPTDHSPFLTRPAELAELLEERLRPGAA